MGLVGAYRSFFGVDEFRISRMPQARNNAVANDNLKHVGHRIPCSSPLQFFSSS